MKVIIFFRGGAKQYLEESKCAHKRPINPSIDVRKDLQLICSIVTYLSLYSYVHRRAFSYTGSFQQLCGVEPEAFLPVHSA